MRLFLIKFYLQIIIFCQHTLLTIANLALKLYNPLPNIALTARLLIKDIENERTVDRKISS